MAAREAVQLRRDIITATGLPIVNEFSRIKKHWPKDSTELVLMLNGKRQWGSPNGLVEFFFSEKA